MAGNEKQPERIYVSVQRPQIDPKQLQDELQRVLDTIGARISKLENLVKTQKDLQYVVLRALVDHGVTDKELTCRVLEELAEATDAGSYEHTMLTDMARHMHDPSKPRRQSPFFQLIPERDDRN
ncbi:hypothetical protein RSK20926_20530 [Roseobacter sp. SK209-2-6]|uniref:hypothetical protein n=1 Tax=Roseobacter sp. SK209-2-6 TaxID=388739 RepID=UPI0000F3E7D2|nr:hypothetical protein [Roseobacter sp. SK209-2-6]EBA16150.1 hypothetical protein RSK20926_20530 [Roseobacter sp. SK209-2-6]